METMKAVRVHEYGGPEALKYEEAPRPKKGGILVSTVEKPSEEEAAAHGVRAAEVDMQPNTAQLAEIAKLVDAGMLRPIVEAVFPLNEARHAQELSQTGHVRGKIVLKVA